MEKLLRPAEAAVVLGIGRSKTYQLIRDGQLPVIRIGTAIRVPATRLEAYIAERTVEPQPAA